VKRKDRALLSQALRPADGSHAVLIGNTVVTATPIAEAANVPYTPRLTLPAGDSDVTAWLVLTGNHPGMSGAAAPMILV
jgi:hypothetical protein